MLILDELLTGETRSTLVLANPQSSDEGRYFVKVSNAGGTVTSTKAALGVVANSLPVANHDTYSTLEDTPLVIAANGVLSNDTDANGQSLSAVLATSVGTGSLAFSANGAFTYVPPTNFSGPVSFTYRISDGYPSEYNHTGANKREVRKDKTGAQSFSHGTTGDASYWISKVVVFLSKKSGGNGTLDFNLGTGLNSGAVAGSSVAIPAASVTNTTQGASFQTYAISYDPPLGPLVAGTTYFLNFENETGEKLFIEYANANSYGSGTYYDDGVNQNKDMRFQIHEPATSNPATVTINVTPVNDAPIALPDTTNTFKNAAVAVKVLANDYDPEGTSLTLVGASTTNGTAVVSGNNLIFKAATNYVGPVVFTYTVSDGTNAATSSVTVNVLLPVNSAPVANNDSYTVPEDVTLTVPVSGILSTGNSGLGVLGNDVDVDGDPLTVSLVSGPSHGQVTLNPDGSFSYTPAPDYNGSDTFTYQVSDGNLSSSPATVTINVTPVADPLQVTTSRMTAGGFELRVGGDVSAYVISASSNLRDWTPLFTNSTPNGPITFTDVQAANLPLRYYRIEPR